MIAIDFPERTNLLAEDQPEYDTLPVHITDDENKDFIYCMKLSQVEIDEIVKTGLLWGSQRTFGNLFHPMLMSTTNPFE